MKTAKLSQGRLIDAAAEIASAEGVDAVTIRRLAEHCGVGAMTIYGYVRTKEDILRLLADRFLADIDRPDKTLPWRRQLTELCESLRAVMLAHPALVPILASQRVDGESAYRGAEAVFSALRDAGIADEDALSAFTALVSFTVGCVQREFGRLERRSIPVLAETDFPHVTALAGQLVARRPDDEFRDALELVVDGIAARMPK